MDYTEKDCQPEMGWLLWCGHPTCHRGMDRLLHERTIKPQWFFSKQKHTCQPWVAVATKLGKLGRQFLLWALIFISINSGTYWKWIWGQQHDWSSKAPIDQIRKKGKAPTRWKCISLFVKDRNGMDPTEAEGVKKRWQDYTEELYRKDLVTQITVMVWSLA